MRSRRGRGHLWPDDRGQGTVEYALAIAVVAIFVVGAILYLQGRTSGLLGGFSTGSAAASASPSASPTGSPGATPTATPTAPPVCTVPNVIGMNRNQTRSAWSGAGFTTAVSFAAGMGSTVGQQNPPATVQGNCATLVLSVDGPP